MRKQDRDPEVGLFLEEFPILREDDRLPIDEDFGYRQDKPPAGELDDPAPEITLPGQFKWAARSRKDKTWLRYAIGVIAAVLLFSSSFGLFSTDAYEEEGGAPRSEIRETAYEAQEGDPEIEIGYALHKEDSVVYSYTVVPNAAEFPMSVYTELRDESGHRSVPEADPDVWESSRAMFEYSMDAAGMESPMTLYMALSFQCDGKEHRLVFSQPVSEMPPEASTSATLELTSTDSILYHGDLILDESDTFEYSFEVTDFRLQFYDDAMNLQGSASVAADAEPAIIEKVGAFAFDYDGEAALSMASDASTKVSCILTVTDQVTGLTYSMESNICDLADARTFREPECELFATAFFSEIQAMANFSDLDSTKEVRLEIWDLLTGSKDMEMDITDKVLAESVYYFDPITTDFIYNAHSEEYNSSEEGFPWSAEFRIVMVYDMRDGEHEKTVSQITTNDRVGWHCKYLTAADNIATFPNGGFVFETESVGYGISVKFNGSIEEVNEETAVLSMEINGVPLTDMDLIEYDGASFMTTFEDGTEDEMYFLDILIQRPAEYPENGQNTAVLTYSYYLPSYGKVVTVKSELNF